MEAETLADTVAETIAEISPKIIILHKAGTKDLKMINTETSFDDGTEMSNVSSTTVTGSIVLEILNEIGELESVLNKINLGHLIPVFHGRFK